MFESPGSIGSNIKPGCSKWPGRIGKERVWIGGGENFHIWRERGAPGWLSRWSMILDLGLVSWSPTLSVEITQKKVCFFFLKWKDKITCCVLPLRNARHTVLSALHIFMKIHWIFIKTLQANYREVEYLAQGYTGRTSGPDSPGCCICVLEHGRVWLTVASLFKNKFLYFRQQYILCRTLSFFHLPCSCPDIL